MTRYLSGRMRSKGYALLLCGATLCTVANFPVVFSAAAEQAAYDLRQIPMPAIPPGTVIGNSAPQNWTHLILKSQPRVTVGDVDRAPQMTVSMAKLLSVTTLANVKQVGPANRPQYVLERVALGLGTKIKGRDVIITSDTQSRLGANLGLIASTVLSGSEAEMKGFQQIVRSPTFLVFDAPTMALYQQQHRPMIVRQAVLIDSATGRLSVLMWLIAKNDAGEYAGAVGTMNLLKPNTLEDRWLSIDANEFTLGIPSSKAIALVRLPPGQSIDIPAQLLPIASQARFTNDTAAQLEAGLRDLLPPATQSPTATRQLPTQRQAQSVPRPGK